MNISVINPANPAVNEEQRISTGDVDPKTKNAGRCLTHRRCVMAIAIMESSVPLIFVGLFFYWTEDKLRYFNVPTTCLTDQVIIGIFYWLGLLCLIEAVLGIWLMGAIKHMRLNQINFWLLIHVTCEIVSLTFVVGFGLAGCTNEQMSTFTFVRIFFRFLEFLIVFVYVEQETLKKMKSKGRLARARFAPLSNATTCSNLSVCGILPEERVTVTIKVETTDNVTSCSTVAVEIPNQDSLH